MTDNQQRLLFVGLLLVGAGIFVLVSWLKDRKKNRAPVYEWKATVLSVKLFSQSAVGGGLGHYAMRSCRVVFELENGPVVELTGSEELSRYPVGTKGTLIFQGTKCEKFTPDP